MPLRTSTTSRRSRFLHLRGHYAFHAPLARSKRRVRRAQVEAAVRYLKSGFWPARCFATLAELDRQYADWREANVRTYRAGASRSPSASPRSGGALRPLPPALRLVGHPDDRGYVLAGRDLLQMEEGSRWPLDRDPLYLETSQPGVFVAGDLRHSSIKRVASAVGEGGDGCFARPLLSRPERTLIE